MVPFKQAPILIELGWYKYIYFWEKKIQRTIHIKQAVDSRLAFKVCLEKYLNAKFMQYIIKPILRVKGIF